jgi:hypothetical protein
MADQPADPPARRVAEPRLLAVESCGFAWLFDSLRRQFLRLPRGAEHDFSRSAAWTDYHGLEIDEDRRSFTVSLEPGARRILRCFIHLEPCRHCGRADADLSTRERLRRPFGGWNRAPQGSP